MPDAGSAGTIVCKYGGCNVTFRSQGEALRHYRIHTDSRPYSCSHCNKSFKRLGCLKRHQAVHLENKPFACAHCDRTFTFKYAATRHESLHTRRSGKKHQNVNGRSKGTGALVASPAVHKSGRIISRSVSPSAKAVLGLNEDNSSASPISTKQLSATPSTSIQYTTAQVQMLGSKHKHVHTSTTYTQRRRSSGEHPVGTSSPLADQSDCTSSNKSGSLSAQLSFDPAPSAVQSTVSTSIPDVQCLAALPSPTSAPHTTSPHRSATGTFAVDGGGIARSASCTNAPCRSPDKPQLSRSATDTGAKRRLNTTLAMTAPSRRALCVRCGKEVTASDNPIQIHSLVFHPTHFTCAATGERLTLATAVARSMPDGTVDVFARQTPPPTITQASDVSNFSPDCVSSFGTVNTGSSVNHYATFKGARSRAKHASAHTARRKSQFVYHYYQPNKGTTTSSPPRRRASVPACKSPATLNGGIRNQGGAKNADKSRTDNRCRDIGTLGGKGTSRSTLYRVCHRCGKHVHAAENPVLIDGLVFHVKHFTCAATGQRLTLGSAVVVTFPSTSSLPPYIRAPAPDVRRGNVAGLTKDGRSNGDRVDVVHHTLAASADARVPASTEECMQHAPTNTQQEHPPATGACTWESPAGRSGIAIVPLEVLHSNVNPDPHGTAGRGFAEVSLERPPPAAEVPGCVTGEAPTSPVGADSVAQRRHAAPVMYMPNKVPVVTMATADDVARSLLLLRQNCPTVTRAH
eukprot:m.47812 g.47812  ORF g.47812 m.47812 type:complete len:745 (+) comp15243_c0_seq3:488-2722(+)